MSPPRLRVGLLGGGWWPEAGGVQSVTRGLAAALQARGHRVFALVFDGAASARTGSRDAVLPAGEWRDQRVGGVRVRRVSVASRELRDPEGLLRQEDLELMAARWCAEHELELVHAHDISGWGAGTLSRLAELGLPVFWTWHDFHAVCPRGQLWHAEGRRCEKAQPEECARCVERTWPQLAGARGLADVLARRMELASVASHVCEKVYAPTRAACDVFARHGLDVGAVQLCENGVAAPGGSAESEVALSPSGSGSAATAGDGTLRVGFLGSVQPSKGVLELARWIVELGAPFELHVHGPRADYHGDRSYAGALEELAAREERVVLHGAYDGIERDAIFARLDLVAVPSLWEEVHGLTAREARAAGLPVFASAVGGLVEAGLHPLPPGDGAAWKSALKRFASDPAWCRELGEGPVPGRSYAEMAEQLLADYSLAL
jgi:glycosyltransferase involved in cell wall biosynthesis